MIAANFALPEEGAVFDKVEFIELEREEAAKLVATYNKEGQAVFPPDQKRWRKDDNRFNSPSGGKYQIMKLPCLLCYYYFSFFF